MYGKSGSINLERVAENMQSIKVFIDEFTVNFVSTASVIEKIMF